MNDQTHPGWPKGIRKPNGRARSDLVKKEPKGHKSLEHESPTGRGLDEGEASGPTRSASSFRPHRGRQPPHVSRPWVVLSDFNTEIKARTPLGRDTPDPDRLRSMPGHGRNRPIGRTHKVSKGPPNGCEFVETGGGRVAAKRAGRGKGPLVKRTSRRRFRTVRPRDHRRRASLRRECRPRGKA